ncbi:TspO/MBR-related protein [Hymenopellis radicata]|nr:TspO/MBR-related protein [Hymenopellis radicata]
MSLYLPSILLEIPRSPVTAVGLPLALGVLSGYPTAKVARGSWYKNLHFPPLRPPRQVFPIVWPLLYIGMGYASHLAMKTLESPLLSSNEQSKLELGIALYYAQLAMNFTWTPLFFVSKQIELALVDSVLLAGTTWYMTALFHGPTNGQTTYFLLPYCAWAGFATYLNAGIVYLNRGRTVDSITKDE